MYLMKPEYSIVLYTQKEAFRFLQLHRKIAEIFGIPFNELYSTKIEWDKKVIDWISKSPNVNDEEVNPEEDAKVKAEAVGT